VANFVVTPTLVVRKSTGETAGAWPGATPSYGGAGQERRFAEAGLVVHAFGNASQVDGETGVCAIEPSGLGLTNNLLGLAIVHTTIQLPFSLYIMRNAFEAVPRELEEAAVVDGANSWQVLRRVFMPTMVPAVITVTLFAFVTSWNEFLGALVMMTRDSSLTLPLVLAAARSVTSLGSTDWGMLQAGVTIAIIPCVLVYFLLQRYYVAGLLSGAVK
jgi:ABC-type glycerol-3-phosphate transport system permease component